MFLVPGYGVQGGTAADTAAPVHADGTALLSTHPEVYCRVEEDPSIRRPLGPGVDCAAASAHRAVVAMRADIIGSLKPGSTEAHTAVSHNHQKKGS